MNSSSSSTDTTSYTLLLSCPSGLSRSQVFVDFNPLYDRKPHPDAKLEESICEIWNKRTKENSSLYNGHKFRYAGHTVQKVCDSKAISSVRLHLGLTDYRTFVGTNLNPSWENFLVPSKDENVRCQHTSNPLGNGAIVETADKKIILLQRSNNVGEFPGHFVFPGGHSEPQEIGIFAHPADIALPEMEHINDKVSREMFDGIIREVVEEIGVPAPSLTEPIFIGISCRKQNVRPTAFFFLKSHLESEEAQKLYSQAQDGYESIKLYTVARDELNHFATMMPGCHQGGYALYELMIETSNDL